jgi:hypothetical protein
VDDEVVTRELSFTVGRRRRTAFLRELQQVCVELGLGCEVDERRGPLRSRVRVLVRGSREGVDALADYARVRWSSWIDNSALG